MPQRGAKRVKILGGVIVSRGCRKDNRSFHPIFTLPITREMAANNSASRTAFNELMRRSVTPVLKPLGFKKSSANYLRRLGDVVQVVNLQVSHGSTALSLSFYINVGLAFDAVCKLTDNTVSEKPKEYECDARGMRARLETLVADVPDVWTCEPGNVDEVAPQLSVAIEALSRDLNAIDSVAAYREHRWFDQMRSLNAQIFYLLGDFDSAWQTLVTFSQQFETDRPLSKPGWWVEQLGLTKLADRS